MQNCAIAEAIQAKFTKLQEKTEINQEWVISRYKKLADYDPADLYDETGKLKNIKDIDEDTRYAIRNMEVTEIAGNATVSKIKLADKKAALDSLGKHLGIFVQDVPGVNINVSIMGQVVKILREEKQNEPVDVIEHKPVEPAKDWENNGAVTQ